MSKTIPLFASLVALGITACSPGEQLPAAPQGVAPPSKAAAVLSPPTARPAPPVIAPQIAPKRPAPAPTLQTVAAVPAPSPVIRPHSLPVPSAAPVVPARPAVLLPAAEPQRAEAPIPSAIVERPQSTPAPIEVAALDPVAATTRATAPLLSTPARPPARTELERLNPGLPRLVGPAPAAETPIARPRPKPGRSTSSSSPSDAQSGFSIPNSRTPSGYSSSLATPATISYEIPHIPQEEPLWCWAAAAQQAIGWVNNGQAPAQCAIVAMAHGLNVEECCNDREGICARTGEIPAIAALVRQYGGQAAETATVPRNPKQVYEILQSGATLLIRLRPAPHDAAVGIRHMIVVRGIEWLRLPNGALEATLYYNDPLGSGYRAVSFDEIEGFFEQALIVRRNT